MKQSTKRILEVYGEEFVQFFRDKLYELTHLSDTDYSNDDFIYSSTRKELAELLYDSYDELGKDQFIKFHSILYNDDYGQTHSLRKQDSVQLKQANANLNRVLIVPLYQHAQVAYIQNNDETHHWIVGERELEYVEFEDVVMVLDKHRKDKLSVNRELDNGYDIVGNFIIVGMDESGFKDLTDEQVEKYMKQFYEPKQVSLMEYEEIMMNMDNHFF